MSIDAGTYTTMGGRASEAAVKEAVEVARSTDVLANLLPIEHWSPSSLVMFMRCPYQWQQRYVRGLKERPGEAPVTGSAVHRAIEENFRQKIESHEDLPIIGLLDLYVEELFPKQVEQEQERKGLEIVWDTDFEKARQRGKVMLTEYQGGVAPRVQPEGVEAVVEVDMGVSIPVQGRFDVERTSTVIDVKTGKSRQTEPKPDWRIQAAVYGKARNRPVEFHSVSASVKKDKSVGTVAVTTPLESPALLVHPTVAQREEIERSVRTIAAMANHFIAIYGPDNDWPTLGRFHPWACGYCGYRSGCPAWREQ